MSTTTTKKNCTPDTGELISIEKAQEWMTNYDNGQRKKGKHKSTQAYFFGKKKLQELLDYEGSIGLRIYYGIDIDGDGKEDKKMIIFPVDKHGKDMPFHPRADDTTESTTVRTMDARPTSGGKALDGGDPTP